MEKGRFTSIGEFYVRDKSLNYYPATFLADSNGVPIVDTVLSSGINPYSITPRLFSDEYETPFANPNNYLVVPSASYMNDAVDSGRTYGALMRNLSTPDAYNANNGGVLSYVDLLAFTPKLGSYDAQYQDTLGAIYDTITRQSNFYIPAFTNAGNYGVGAFYAGAGLPLNDARMVFGYANSVAGGADKTLEYGNSQHGNQSIIMGYEETRRVLDGRSASLQDSSYPSTSPNPTDNYSFGRSNGYDSLSAGINNGVSSSTPTFAGQGYVSDNINTQAYLSSNGANAPSSAGGGYNSIQGGSGTWTPQGPNVVGDMPAIGTNSVANDNMAKTRLMYG